MHIWGWSAPDEHHRPLAPEALRAALGDWSGDGLLASVADLGTLGIWMPDEPRREEKPAFRRIQVPSLVFVAADAFDLLTSLPTPPPPCSDSLKYWTRLARYTLLLLARRQFVPDVEERRDGSLAALWRPFAQSRDELAWLERFAAVMPPVCYAVAADPADEGGEGAAVGPLRLVEDFLGATVDAVIRRQVGADPFFARIHERAKSESAGEVRWLSALLGAERTIPGQPSENLPLVDLVRTWSGRLDEGTAAEPLRLCFTLVEPDVEPPLDVEATPEPSARPPWQVQLHLQSHDARGQRFDIAQIWAEHGGRPSLLGRRMGHRRDQLLAELARAAEVLPVLERLPPHTPPTSLELTTAEAYAFLREWAPLLTARGFGVNVPTWATRTDRRLGLRLFVRPTGHADSAGPVTTGMLGLESMLEFDWRVAVGDVQLALPEFERLASQRTPLVKYQEDWLEIDAAAADAALTFMRAQAADRMTLRDALRVAYGVEELEAGLPIVGLSGTGWIEQLLGDLSSVALASLPQPPEFRGTLRPYQRRGLDWLAFLNGCGLGACLADDMGLGKTIQLIALLLHERESSAEVGPTLLFAPASVVGNWEREIQRFTGKEQNDRLESRSHRIEDDPQEGRPRDGLRVLVHHGPDRLEGDAFVAAAPQHDVIITTYALGHRDLDDLRRVRWHRIVLDEAQKIKNPQAGQTLAIRAIPSAHRVALTGTPIENHLPELWSIMDVLNPGLLGSAAQFRKRFVVPIEKLGDREREAQLRRMLQPFLLRRSKADPTVICDLPEKMEMCVFCNLTPEQAAWYQRIVDETLGVIDAASGIRRRGLILSMLTRLKQVCNHPCQLLREEGPLDERSGKCERLVEMLEEVLAEGDAALVFTQYREMGHLLERLLTERLRIEIPFLHGGTPTQRRTEMVDRFQDPRQGIRVFLLSLRAGGLGLNLTAANHVFHFDRWWNPAVEAQATDRAHRVGQTRRVQVHKFVCLGTVEERIDRMLESKRALADHIIGSGDDWLTGLSTNDLRDTIMLAREAVG